jgi:hypothetical protein
MGGPGYMSAGLTRMARGLVIDIKTHWLHFKG